MKKSLAKKITLSILAGAVLFTTSSVWAATASVTDSSWTGIVVNSDSVVSASATSKGSIAIGDDAMVFSADDGIAVGSGTRANAENSIALGVGARVLEAAKNSVAIGRISKVESYVENSVALGNSAEVKSGANNSVALGYGSEAKESNVVSVGSGNSNDDYQYRRIVNVKDGVNNNDAATVGQMNTELDKKADKDSVYTKNEVYNKTEIDRMIATPADIDGINQRIDKTNAKINKVGAGAAALAALHRLDYDPDDKLTFSAGMGNYAGENAAALGTFYRPNEKFMLSLGGTMGNGENMVNLGLSIGFDKPNGFAKMSKRELIQKVNVMEAKYEQVEAENEAMKAEIAEMKAMLQELLAKK